MESAIALSLALALFADSSPLHSLGGCDPDVTTQLENNVSFAVAMQKRQVSGKLRDHLVLAPDYSCSKFGQLEHVVLHVVSCVVVLDELLHAVWQVAL